MQYHALRLSLVAELVEERVQLAGERGQLALLGIEVLNHV